MNGTNLEAAMDGSDDSTPSGRLARTTTLADLVQANAVGQNTCRISVATAAGRGVIFLERGEVVDATFGDLTGEDAFHALVNETASRLSVTSGMTTAHRRIRSGWQTLVTRAMTLRLEGRVPAPGFRGPVDVELAPEDDHAARRAAPTVPSPPSDPAATAPVPRALLEGPLAAPVREAPQAPAAAGEAKARPAAAPAAAPVRPARGRGPLIAAGLALAALAVLAVAFLRPGQKAPAAGAAPAVTAAPKARPPVESSDLKAQGDAVPQLLSGETPRSPDPDAAVVPTIVLRILVDETGAVADAKVFRSRLDLARFEDSALGAVKTFRFRPGQKGGAPVPVWINWSVTFR